MIEPTESNLEINNHALKRELHRAREQTKRKETTIRMLVGTLLLVTSALVPAIIRIATL